MEFIQDEGDGTSSLSKNRGFDFGSRTLLTHYYIPLASDFGRNYFGEDISDTYHSLNSEYLLKCLAQTVETRVTLAHGDCRNMARFSASFAINANSFQQKKSPGFA